MFTNARFTSFRRVHTLRWVSACLGYVGHIHGGEITSKMTLCSTKSANNNL
jgi:hypothetical protein